MINSEMQPIQRSLVVACGKLAEAAAAQLKAANMPEAAVSIVNIHLHNLDDNLVAVTAAVHQVSQTTALVRLAAVDRQLDRLHELAIFFLVDAVDGTTADKLADFVTQVTFSIQKQLGIHVAILLLVMASEPDSDPVQTFLRSISTQTRLFDRGIWAAGTVNEDGLQLPDEAHLIDHAARFIQALIMTPLRDAPEWLAEAGHRDAPGLVCSLGTAGRQWHPEEEVRQLARRWAAEAINHWLAPVAKESTSHHAAVQNWINNAGITPDMLTEKVGGLLSPWSFAAWTLPQPWQLADKCQRLARMVDAITNSIPETTPLLHEEMGPQIERWIEQLTAVCQQQMNDMPVAAVSRSRSLLEQVGEQIGLFSFRLPDRQIQQEQEAQTLAAEQASLQQQMAACLAAWPDDSWTSWFSAALHPWQWPKLIGGYHRIQQLARRMVSLLRQQAAAADQGQILTTVEAVYESLQKLVQRLESQVEEVGEMLTYVQQTLTDSEPSPACLLPHYQQFVESPMLEARQAAAAIGGIGKQVTQLDDAMVDDLLAAGEKRMHVVYKLSAAEVLAILYATQSARTLWWQQQWMQAAPLWQFDGTRLSDGQRGQQAAMTLVAAHQAAMFDDWQASTKKTVNRLVEMPDKTQVLILRLRSGIPIL